MPSEAEHREQAAFDERMMDRELLRTTERENDRLVDELRALRAENERLARAFADSEAACLIQVRMLRAENERLRNGDGLEYSLSLTNADLRAALRDAIDLAEEGWAYAGDYFREKWELDTRLDALKQALGSDKAG